MPHIKDIWDELIDEIFEEIEQDAPNVCPKCDTPLIVETRGSMWFRYGEVDDDLEDYLICPVCGYEKKD